MVTPSLKHKVQEFDAAESTKIAVWRSQLVQFKSCCTRATGFYFDNQGALGTELLSGFTVSALKAPEAILCSFIAGVHPLDALNGSFIMGLVTTLLGGRPAMVSGCSFAWACVLRGIMENDGPFKDKCVSERREYLRFIVVLAGMLQVVCALLRSGCVARLVPKTVLIGFVNGTAFTVFLVYLQVFKRQASLETTSLSGCSAESYGIREDPRWFYLDEGETWRMILLAVIVAGFFLLLQYLPGKKFRGVLVRPSQWCPPVLAGLLAACFFEWGAYRCGDWSTPLIEGMSRIDGEWPAWHIPDVPWHRWATWRDCFPRALALCAVGLVEALLTSEAVDGFVTEQSSEVQKTQECGAQGIGNVVCGLFSAAGGSALLAQSSVNTQNGARGRLSTFSDAFWMIFWITLFGPAIEALPTAGLFGIFFMVTIHLFNWSSILLIVRRSLPWYMIVTIILVTVLMIFTNCAVAVGIGILWECLWYVWISGGELNVWPVGTDHLTFHVSGDVFFANADHLARQLEPPSQSCQEVLIDLTRARLLDHSALYVLGAIGQRYKLADKEFSISVTPQDYERYMAICDEYRPGDSLARRRIPARAVTPIEGKVLRKQVAMMQGHRTDIVPAIGTDKDAWKPPEGDATQQVANPWSRSGREALDRPLSQPAEKETPPVSEQDSGKLPRARSPEEMVASQVHDHSGVQTGPRGLRSSVDRQDAARTPDHGDEDSEPEAEETVMRASPPGSTWDVTSPESAPPAATHPTMPATSSSIDVAPSSDLVSLIRNRSDGEHIPVCRPAGPPAAALVPPSPPTPIYREESSDNFGGEEEWV